MNTLGYDPHRPNRDEQVPPVRPIASSGGGGEEPEIFDALADLFIGPAEPSPTAAARPEPEATVSQTSHPTEHPAGHPNGPSASTAPSPLTGPGSHRSNPIARPTVSHHPPLRLTDAPPPEVPGTASGPKPATQPITQKINKPVPGHTQRPVAASFAKPAVPPAPVRAAKPEAEALLLGALPGRASSWSRQYAAGRAMGAGRPVAFVRCGQGSVSVERCGSAETRAAYDPSDSLAGVLDGLRNEGALVVVRAMDADGDALATDPRLDRLTLLSGADDAAIVSAYRSIKQMLDQRANAQTISRMPAIRVVLCGSDAQTLANARDRLTDALNRFAGKGVEVLAGPERVKPVAATLTFDGGAFDETDDRESRSLDAILDRLAMASARTTPASVGTVEPKTRVPARVNPPAQGPAASDAAQPAPARTVPAAPTAKPVAKPVAKPIAQPAPAPTGPAKVAIGSTATRAHAAVALDAEIPGLTAIAARCPFAKGVSLRLDAQGGLHLVAFLSGDDQAAVETLAVAREWANEHLDLLKLTPGAEALASLAGEHLVTDEPKRVRRLLDGERKVYVTAAIVVAGETRTVCVAIN